MSELTEPVGVIDVRRRKRAFALTEHERIYLSELLADRLSEAERTRQTVKAMGSLRGALQWDKECRLARELLEVFK